MDIVTNATQATFQIYIISLGNSGSFGKEEQAIAFDKAKLIIASEFREKLKTFITQNYGDLQKCFTNQIKKLYTNQRIKLSP